ncbi:MAG: YHS domain-containing protein [Desulfobulbaceae bacterium]|nr:YHS domain-containing protein [Desulfobulbaceae bacterium]
MSPIRLLILASLGYILYRLLFGRGQGRTNSGPSQAEGKRQVDDVLVEDPVCHLYIPQREAESLIISGTTHYFCSPECRKKFQSEKRS